MSARQKLLLAWLVFSSLLAFLMFAWDKVRAGRPGSRRISEFHLALIGAVGGWPGGLLAMLSLRHKTAKLSFQIKYAAAFILWCAWLYLAWLQVASRS